MTEETDSNARDRESAVAGDPAEISRRDGNGRRALNLDVDALGVALLTLDCPGEKTNTLSVDVWYEFDELFRKLSVQTHVRALIILSGKANNFIAGADIEDFLLFKTMQQAEKMSLKAQELLSRVETSRFPVIAAIHGACLGGGMELALACRYRIATDHPRTVFGQPEVQLGLIPGAGATQRLPRLIGIAEGLDLILTGRRVTPKMALRLGVVDELVPPEILGSTARAVAERMISSPAPERRRRGKNAVLENNPVSRRVIFARARRSVEAKTQGRYPAPLKALEAVHTGLSKGQAAGYAAEARFFGELAMTDACRQLVHLFFAGTATKNEPLYPLDGADPRPIKRLGILGGGFMGAGIAALAAARQITVRLKERDHEAAGGALQSIDRHYQAGARRGRITALEGGRSRDRVSVCLDYSGFKTVDMVIEAVFEDLELKRRVLRETEELTHPECLFASNTSSLPISRIAATARRPEVVIGLHFFSPVHKMPLLEIIVTPKTERWVTASAMAFGSALGKTCIVVRDGAGFYTTRILAPYMNEAARLLEEGADIENIDGAMRRWGFPVGPLALLDEVGIDVAAKVARIINEAFGSRLDVPSSMHWVGADGRQGRKNGRGFYTYDGKSKRVDKTVYHLLPYGERRRPFADDTVQKRLAFTMINEAALCLQEEILLGPRDGDVGAVLGLGFPAFRGGPFRYIDTVGVDDVVRTLEGLAQQHGERFQPAEILVDMARHKRLFYPGDKN